LFYYQSVFPSPVFPDGINETITYKDIYTLGCASVPSTYVSSGKVNLSPYYGVDATPTGRSILMTPELPKSCIGSVAFLRSSYGFLGIVVETDNGFTRILDGALIDNVRSGIEENWTSLQLSYVTTSPYVIANKIKRGFRYRHYLGIRQQYMDIRLFSTMPTLRSLPNIGGIMITSFIHGFDTVSGSYILDSGRPMTATDIKVYSALQGSEVYNDFYRYGFPIVMTSVQFANGTRYEVGQYNQQVGVGDFIYDANRSFDEPFTIGYYFYRDGKVWEYKEVSMNPSIVTYRDENGYPVTQLNTEFPYPLYGFEETGIIQFI
jgi:hypothetical protein